MIATVEGKRYLVSMLGPGSDWVKNVEAAHGDAVIRHGRRRPVHLVAMPPEQRAPILRVRAHRVERPTALPAARRRAAVRLRGDRRSLSGVPDRSHMKSTAPGALFQPMTLRQIPRVDHGLASGRMREHP